jgi:hypothetical protein
MLLAPKNIHIQHNMSYACTYSMGCQTLFLLDGSGVDLLSMELFTLHCKLLSEGTLTRVLTSTIDNFINVQQETKIRTKALLGTSSRSTSTTPIKPDLIYEIQGLRTRVYHPIVRYKFGNHKEEERKSCQELESLGECLNYRCQWKVLNVPWCHHLLMMRMMMKRRCSH